MSEEQNNDQQKSLNDEQIINKNTKEKTDLSKDTESEKNITNKNSRNIKGALYLFVIFKTLQNNFL